MCTQIHAHRVECVDLIHVRGICLPLCITCIGHVAHTKDIWMVAKLPTVTDNVHCYGAEDDLMSCVKEEISYSDSDYRPVAGVRCFGKKDTI